MPLPSMRRLYRTLGGRYRYVMLAGETWAALVVVVVTVFFASRFYPEVSAGQVTAVMGLAAALTIASVASSSLRSNDTYAQIERWQRTAMATPRETVAAWEAATTLTLVHYRRSSITVVLVTVIPTAIASSLLWGTGWAGLGAIVFASLIPAVYATVLSYSVGEVLARPLIEDIAAALPDDFGFRVKGLPLATRLWISLPAYTSSSGIAVASLVADGGGSDRLVLVVVVSLGIGLFLSAELLTFLGASLTGPLGHVRRGLERVRAGDYDDRVPVLSSDEIGQLAHDFNRMASGLAEREELRETFSTYVDRDVAELILSGQFPAEGIEVDVSMLFCDVRNFTAYAEGAAATDVISTLNSLFSEIVPIVEAYGGHVDKFLGDGLLAVFGAPGFYPDHADRAVDAARMIVDAVALGQSGLTVGAGVNSGRVVAGPLGGAGRLNFSVIGDAVNVAARVEAATRETGDDVLLTATTRAMLVRPQALISRGELPLKGKSAPVELFAPVPGSAQWGSTSARSITT
ncbi:MAG: adenylate/guanylate cyclase domain-containing protein [Nocardioides sp.]